MPPNDPADSQARAQALDVERSFLVRAPAGSGKTELLIQRYLALLARVEAPEAVVAITFTRKAAAEMSARVLKALREATGELAQAALERDRQFGWHLLENPSRMAIQTIDSLCTNIAGRMPWMARLGDMPEIAENAAALYAEAARETLRMVAESGPNAEAVATLLSHLDNRAENVARLIAAMLGRREQWMGEVFELKNDPRAAREYLEESLRLHVEEALETAARSFPEHLKAEAAKLARMEAFPSAQPEDVPRWLGLAAILLTGKSEWRQRVDARAGFPPGKPKTDLLALLATLRENEPLRYALANLRGLPPTQYTGGQWEVLAAILKILPLAVAQLVTVFRDRGAIDFSQLGFAARNALGAPDDPTDLALGLGQRIEHILVDEFQDTSRAQFQLLKSLTAGWSEGDGRTLFLVGDRNQSIYRFRQAEVGLFDKAKDDGVGSVKLETLQLTVNFRSVESIVDWVGHVFEGAAAKPSDGSVSLHPFIEDDGGDEAKKVFEIVRGAPKENYTIAILARTRKHLLSIVKTLRENGEPFQAVELVQLDERPVIQDLMALTCALLHRADRISWLAILRAPWCGLALADLEAIAGGEPRSAVWDLMRQPDLRLTIDGANRLARAVPVLEKALDNRGTAGLRQLVEDAWRALGGPYCVDGESDLEDAAAFFDILDNIEVGGDLIDFQVLRDRVESLYAQPDPGAQDRLQVMTIHKAKGLEFDCVMVPALHRGSGKFTQPLLYWTRRDNGRIFAAPIRETSGDKEPISGLIAKLEKDKENEETRRLLYVAATRAKRELHLLANAKRTSKGAIRQARSGTFLATLSDEFAPLFQDATAKQATAAEAASGLMLRRVPEGWAVPAFDTAVAWESPWTVEAAPRIAFEWVSGRLRHAGTVVHAMLQRIAREGLARWNPQTVAASKNVIGKMLANLGVAPEETAESVSLVEEALMEAITEERGRWILSPHFDARSEYEISGVVDGKFFDGRIDRTFVDERGTRWIVDYKTSAHSGGDTKEFIDEQQRRYGPQLERYAKLMAVGETRPVKLGLYFPLLRAWREWEMETARAMRPGASFDGP